MISVTEVETLLADPYAYYARRVLRLFPLDPLDAEVGAADYGNLVHATMARFIRRLAAGPWPGPDAARALFDDAAEAALAEAGARPGLLAFWRPRLTRIGGFVVAREEEARAANGIARSVTELKGEVLLRQPGPPRWSPGPTGSMCWPRAARHPRLQDRHPARRG